MNVKEKCIKFLVDNGMWSEQADKVFGIFYDKLCEEDGYSQKMFREDESTYPTQLYSILFLRLRGTALEWIDKNMPMAWFRPMFDPEQLTELMDQQKESK